MAARNESRGERVRRGVRAKRRGKIDERLVADMIGGKRYPADSGGPIDVESETLQLQVKGSGTVPSDRMLAALDTARGGSIETKLAGAAFVRHGGARIRTVIMFDLEDFARWWNDA